MLWYPASRTILSRDDVFPPEERYNWRKYDLVCPTNKWRMRYYECAPIHSHYGRLKKVKYPNIATVELWKYQQKRWYLWRFYSGIFSMTAGFVLWTLVYKTKTEEIYKINNIGSDYPHYITNKFIWYYNYYRVYWIPYMKFHIQTFSYALNYTGIRKYKLNTIAKFNLLYHGQNN